MLSIFSDASPDAERSLQRLARRGADDVEAVAPVVREVIAAVKLRGDAAVLELVAKFEKRAPAELVQKSFDGAGALARIDRELRKSLEIAADRITRFHEKQRLEGLRYQEEGVTLGLRARPLARVGVYAPGG